MHLYKLSSIIATGKIRYTYFYKPGSKATDHIWVIDVKLIDTVFLKGSKFRNFGFTGDWTSFSQAILNKRNLKVDRD